MSLSKKHKKTGRARRRPFVVSKQRLAEIEAIKDEDIDTSDIPEADAEWFRKAKLILPRRPKT